MTKDKIKGMFLGTFLGDALGLPVESFTADQIKKDYGEVKTFMPSPHHGLEAGCYTDDTQLTIAVAEAMIDAGGLNMDSQVKRHVEAFRACTKGWGKSTLDSVRNLANGADWHGSATGNGMGNGIAMKISPVGAYAAIEDDDDHHYGEAVSFSMVLSQMTHATSIAASAGLGMMAAAAYCVKTTPEDFFDASFINEVKGAASLGKLVLPDTIKDDIVDRMEYLEEYEAWDREEIITQWKGGCYCYESIPFSLMFFLKNPKSLDAMFDVINAGGDTDSNGSMVGMLLGALNGTAIFGELPKQANQTQLAQVLDVAERFADNFGFKS